MNNASIVMPAIALLCWLTAGGCAQTPNTSMTDSAGFRDGVACSTDCQDSWDDVHPISWDVFGQGEFLGHPRLPHVSEYRLRPDDVVQVIYRVKAEKSPQSYQLNVGDLIRVESLTAPEINQETLVQPDGTVSLNQLGQVFAAGRSVDELRNVLEEQHRPKISEPLVTVTPLKVNTRLEEFRAAIDSRSGTLGQGRQFKVAPEGTIRLPAIGTVPVVALTLTEAKQEIELRYAAVMPGLDITVILEESAPHSIFVLGEVQNAGRFAVKGPTSVLQAVAIAGGWNPGACLTDVIIFRQSENWSIEATTIDIRDGLYNKSPCPNDIWLRDGDVVLIPKRPMQVTDDFIELVFTKGIYGILPTHYSFILFRQLSTL